MLYLALVALTFLAIRSLLNPKNKRRSTGAMSGAFGAIDAIYNPAAERTRMEKEAQKERVVPMPSAAGNDPRDGEIVISLKEPSKDH